MVTLVQVHEEKGFAVGVPVGGSPVAELYLNDNQRVVAFKMHAMTGARGRVTEDYAWTATIETRP